MARHIRQDYPHLMLPIIMVSANKLEEHVVEGLQVMFSSGPLIRGLTWLCLLAELVEGLQVGFTSGALMRGLTCFVLLPTWWRGCRLGYPQGS